MKRDTRVNLLFLALFLAVSLPGAVILFKKKLDPNAARMDQPDAIVRELPYMAPLPAPPGVKWIAPLRTRQWLAELNRGRGGGDDLLSEGDDTTKWQPVISDDHVLQVLSASHSSSTLILSLLIWDASTPGAAEDYSFKLDTAGRSLLGKTRSIQSTAVPHDVKRELMGLNMVRPPAAVTWISVEFSDGGQNASAARLWMDYRAAGRARQSVVKLP